MYKYLQEEEATKQGATTVGAVDTTRVPYVHFLKDALS